MKRLCATHEHYPEPLFGKGTSGEDMMIEIHADRIVATTFQHNGWVRKNILHPHTCVSEETYEGRWRNRHRGPRQSKDPER